VDADALTFDRVAVHDAHGERVLSVPQFLQLPLDERIRLNFQRALRFYQGNAEVSRQQALQSLMRAARNGTA